MSLLCYNDERNKGEIKIRRILTTIFVLLTTILLTSCTYDTGKIVIGEGAWESNEFYNYLAKVIIEEGYEKEVEITNVDTPILVESLKLGDIHVNVETWSENMPTYNSDIENGYYEEIATNFNDNEQGVFIPTYLHEEYNIETIQDLVDYKDLFDQEDGKAIVYGGTSGWEVTEFLQKKFSNEELYPDLVENFVFKPIDNTAALNATLIRKYEEEKPWVGYNWKPTAVMGRLDMYLLKDEIEEYDTKTGAGNIPTNKVTVVVTKDFEKNHPDVYKFLTNFETESQVASDALAYMEENDMDALEVAKWWLIENVDIWEQWVDESVKEKVLDEIQ